MDLGIINSGKKNTPAELAKLPKVDFMRIETAFVADGNPVYIVTVKRPKHKGFRPAAAVALEHKIVLAEQVYASWDDAIAAGKRICETWGKKATEK